MKKLIFSMLIALFTVTTLSAQRYITKTGHIFFHSDAPLETIEAHNKQVNSALDVRSGMFVFKVLMKSFVFEKALMQEHFNEEYVESDTYPNAFFKGKILNNSSIHYTIPGSYNVWVEGTLTLHGVTKKVKEKGTFEVTKGGTIHATSKFPIVLKAYNISIPAAVMGKIAEELVITVDEHLKPLK